MTRIRRALAGGVTVVALACAACSPTPANPSSASSTPAVDYTQPGVARSTLEQLQQASGSDKVIKVDVTRNSAQLVVVAKETAETWTMRGGKPEQVDGDTQYVGQASFALADYPLDDVGALFEQAAAVSGSTQKQDLQIVEYSAGAVYLTVTTSPESQTVFFNRDGKPVPTLAMTDAAGLRAGLDDAVGGRTQVYAITITPTAGVSVDAPNGQPGYVRSVRAPKYPARSELHSDKPPYPLTFDPSVVDPELLAELVARYGGANHAAVSFAIDRRDALYQPTIRVTAEGKTVVCDLSGNDITTLVKR